MEYLSFCFGQKLDFMKYYQNILNPTTRHVSQSTLTYAIHKVYENKKRYKIYFDLLMHTLIFALILITSKYTHHLD